MSPRHELIVLDQDLCVNSEAFGVIRDAFKTSLALASHFCAQKQHVDFGTFSFCVMTKDKNGVEMRPLLSQMSPVPSSQKEVLASLDLLQAKQLEHSKHLNKSKEGLLLSWPDLAKALQPHTDYPPKEGYRVVLITGKKVTMTEWAQMGNCLLFQIAKCEKLAMDGENARLTSFENVLPGLQVVKIPAAPTEWEAFFKLYVFDPLLNQEVDVMLYLSSSIYSKLVIHCVSTPVSLAMTTPPNSGKESLELEAVSQVYSQGLCLGHLNSTQPALIRPKFTKYADKDNQLNKQRFLAMIFGLRDHFLLVKTRESPTVQTKHFVIMPRQENQTATMIELVAPELLLPRSRESYETVKEIEVAVKVEIDNAMESLTCDEFFDILDHETGLLPSLGASQKRPTSARSSKLPSKRDTGSTRGRGGRGTQGDSTKRGKALKQTKLRYNPVVIES